MMREKKQTYVIITPKNDKAVERMSYHGDRWILRETKEKLTFSTVSEPHYCLLSRDGNKILLIKKTNDSDFDVRVIG
jgi:hypothetical protein